MTSRRSRGVALIIRSVVLLLALMAPAMAQSGNPAHDRLVNLPLPEQRQALQELLAGALGDRGGAIPQTCPAATSAYMAGLDERRFAYWDVRCGGSGAWRIAVAPEGGVSAITPCARQVGACFVPVAGGGNDPGAVAEARCNAACALQSGDLRRACFARCLEGSETIAASGVPGQERHVVIYLADLPGTPEGVLVGGLQLEVVRQQARLACEAVAGAAGACRQVIAVANRCAAVVRSTRGDIRTGSGLELDDAEAAARSACPEGSLCEIVVSGC